MAVPLSKKKLAKDVGFYCGYRNLYDFRNNFVPY
jgi:hypothetical protein